MTPQCSARLQSNRDGDDNPFRCGHAKGHSEKTPHLCECGCGMMWGRGRYGAWQAYDLIPGMRVFRKGKPKWIRTVQRTTDGRWNLLVHPSVSDYSKLDGRTQYGARGVKPEYVFECYKPLLP